MESALAVFNNNYSTIPLQSQERMDPGFSPWKSGEIPKVKRPKFKLWHQQFLALKLLHTISGNSPKLTSKCSYQFMVHQLLPLGSRPQLSHYLDLSLLKFQGCSLSCTSVLWGVEKKPQIFSLLSFILMLGWEWWPPSSFTCQNWKVSKVSIQ